MLRQFFDAQYSNPKKGDWCITVMSDIKILDLQSYSFEQIQLMSKRNSKHW